MKVPDQSPLLPKALEGAQDFCNESYLASIQALHETRHNVHLILGGGGMKCAAIPGALIALLEKYGFQHPERITASSGSVGSANAFVAGTPFEMVEVWANGLCSPDFIDTKVIHFLKSISLHVRELVFNTDHSDKKRAIDIQHLVYEIIGNRMPKMADAINKSDIDYKTATTSMKSGEPNYFGNKSDDFPDDDRLLLTTMAAKIMPIFSGQKVIIDGQQYIDTPVSSDVYSHLRRAIEREEDKVLVLPVSGEKSFNRGYSARIQRWFYESWLRSMSWEFRQGYKQEILKNNDMFLSLRKLFEDGGKTIINNTEVCVVPQISPFGTLNNAKEVLHNTIQKGWMSIMDNKELKDFFKN